jgi:hypothetical protein
VGGNDGVSDLPRFPCDYLVVVIVRREYEVSKRVVKENSHVVAIRQLELDEDFVGVFGAIQDREVPTSSCPVLLPVKPASSYRYPSRPDALVAMGSWTKSGGPSVAILSTNLKKSSSKLANGATEMRPLTGDPPPDRYVQHHTHDAAQLDMGGWVCVGSVDIGEEDAGGDAGLWVRSPPRFKVFPLLGCGDVHGDAGAVVHPQCRRIEAGCVAGLELHRQSSGRFTLDRCIDQERWAS